MMLYWVSTSLCAIVHQCRVSVCVCFLSESCVIMSVLLSGMKRRDESEGGEEEYHKTPRWKLYQSVNLGECATSSHESWFCLFLYSWEWLFLSLIWFIFKCHRQQKLFSIYVYFDGTKNKPWSFIVFFVFITKMKFPGFRGCFSNKKSFLQECWLFLYLKTFKGSEIMIVIFILTSEVEIFIKAKN